MSKPGRKPDPNSKRRLLSVKLSEQDHAALSRLAKKDRKPISTYVRDAALSLK